MHDFFQLNKNPTLLESLLTLSATYESCVPVEMLVIYYKNNLLLHI